MTDVTYALISAARLLPAPMPLCRIPRPQVLGCPWCYRHIELQEPIARSQADDSPVIDRKATSSNQDSRCARDPSPTGVTLTVTPPHPTGGGSPRIGRARCIKQPPTHQPVLVRVKEPEGVFPLRERPQRATCWLCIATLRRPGKCGRQGTDTGTVRASPRAMTNTIPSSTHPVKSYAGCRVRSLISSVDSPPEDQTAFPPH